MATGPPYVAVVGPGDPDAGLEGLAEEVGRGLAERGAVLVCGGLGGVMAAACRGARDAGGTAVGLLPGRDRAAGNEHLSVALATGIGELRNGLIVGCSDVVVAIGGSWGTMSEVALALRTGKPVVALTGWHVDAPPDPLLHEVPEAAAALRVLDALLAP